MIERLLYFHHLEKKNREVGHYHSLQIATRIAKFTLRWNNEKSRKIENLSRKIKMNTLALFFIHCLLISEKIR